MKILFDQSTPKTLAKSLSNHEVRRAFQMGWSQLENGDLIDAAEQSGFDLFLTCDKNIRYQQNLRGRRIAILLLSTNHWPTIKPFADRIAATVAAIAAGAFSELDCGKFSARKR